MIDCFLFNETVFRVHSETASDLQWLRENLLPCSREPTDSAFTIDIHCSIDAERFDHLLKDLSQAQAVHSPVFSMDGEPSLQCSWRGPDSTQYAYDPEFKCVYLIDSAAVNVDVVADKWRPSIRVALLRVIREISTHSLKKRAHLQLHAAASSLDGRGALIAGPKKAGKTTLLVQLLQAGADYIANDRSVLGTAPDGKVCLGGMPTVVSVREYTVTLVPQLQAAQRAGWHARETLAECQDNYPKDKNESNALVISPAQFCSLLGKTPISQAALDLLIFPRIDPAISGVKIIDLSNSRARDLLSLNAFPIADTLFAPLGQAANEDPGLTLSYEEIANICTARELVLGSGAEINPSVLRTLWS